MAPAYRALPANRIVRIVRAHGFNPLFRPMRQGDTYVLRALDGDYVEYRLVIDAYTGRTRSVRPTRDEAGYGRYGGPVYGRLFGPRNDRYGFGAPRPPRAVPHARPMQPSMQPGTVAQGASSAPGNEAQAPLPRPRPYVMEATSSTPVDPPKSAEPQNTPPSLAPPNAVPAHPAAAPADTPQNNGGASMPPVTPLD
jgi:hypothetical protein